MIMHLQIIILLILIISYLLKKGFMKNPSASKLASNNGVNISGVLLGGAGQATGLNVLGTPVN